MLLSVRDTPEHSSSFHFTLSVRDTQVNVTNHCHAVYEAHQNTDQPLSLSVRDTPEHRPTLVTQCMRHTRTQTNPCHSVYETHQITDQPVLLSIRDKREHRPALVTQC